MENRNSKSAFAHNNETNNNIDKTILKICIKYNAIIKCAHICYDYEFYNNICRIAAVRLRLLIYFHIYYYKT